MIELHPVRPKIELEMPKQHSSLSQYDFVSLESDAQLVHSPHALLPPHIMVTRSQRGVVKPVSKYALTSLKSSAIIPREPHNIRSALAHPS